MAKQLAFPHLPGIEVAKRPPEIPAQKEVTEAMMAT
jgi:hypothetical protein